MSQKTMMLEGYLPEFSGLLSEAWAPLLHGPAKRAAKDYASSQDSDRKLDRVDFLDAFVEAGDFPRQCSTLARSCAQSAAPLARRQLPQSCSPRQKNYDTRAICGARIQIRQSWRSPGTAFRSSRLSAAWVIVAISFAKRCGVGEPTCSKRGSVRSTRIICSLRASGAVAVATAPNSGVACRRKGSGDPCARLASGQHVDVGRKRSANNSCKGCPPP